MPRIACSRCNQTLKDKYHCGVFFHVGECREQSSTTQPPITADADPEYSTRIEAARVTLEFSQPLPRPIDSGRKPITDAPLFYGEAQEELF
jgi:hypothetical protein